jgi:hypothetical protein
MGAERVELPSIALEATIIPLYDTPIETSKESEYLKLAYSWFLHGNTSNT